MAERDTSREDTGQTSYFSLNARYAHVLSMVPHDEVAQRPGACRLCVAKFAYDSEEKNNIMQPTSACKDIAAAYQDLNNIRALQELTVSLRGVCEPRGLWLRWACLP